MDDDFQDHSTTGIKVRADHQNMLHLFHNPDVIADGSDDCCLLQWRWFETKNIHSTNLGSRNSATYSATYIFDGLISKKGILCHVTMFQIIFALARRDACSPTDVCVCADEKAAGIFCS